MNNIQMNGMMNSAVNFKANSAKVVTQVVEKTNKSGVYQAAVEKLAALQRELEYGCSLLRANNWFNPRNVQESDKAIYEIYQSKIKNLEVEKEKVIDGMMKQIKENPNYRNLSDDCMKNIRQHIDCGSTWGGFYFNDESIMKIIERMK
jgi:hypothetical protein